MRHSAFLMLLWGAGASCGGDGSTTARVAPAPFSPVAQPQLSIEIPDTGPIDFDPRTVTGSASAESQPWSAPSNWPSPSPLLSALSRAGPCNGPPVFGPDGKELPAFDRLAAADALRRAEVAKACSSTDAVEVILTYSNNGRVRDVEVDSSTDVTTATCLVAKLKRVRIPAFAPPEVRIKWHVR